MSVDARDIVNSIVNVMLHIEKIDEYDVRQRALIIKGKGLRPKRDFKVCICIKSLLQKAIFNPIFRFIGG